MDYQNRKQSIMDIEETIRKAIKIKGTEGQNLLKSISIEGAGISELEARLLLSIASDLTGHYECFGESLGGAAVATLVLRGKDEGLQFLEEHIEPIWDLSEQV